MAGGGTTASQSFEYWKIDDASRSPFAAIKRIKLSKDSTDLVNREMQYDAVGNVTKIVDGVNSETIDYTYDELNRVLTASVPTGESFVYDTIGNMTSKAGTALDYGTTSPTHAVKSHGTTTYTYDANGSLTAKGTQTIKYDPEQRPILVQDGTSFHRAAYDGDGVRRKRDDSNGTVHYLGGYERKLAADSNSSDTVTKYYSASLGALSRPVAFRRGGTLQWVGADHLGGTIRVMDSSFTAVDGMRYKPYGEDRDAGTSLNTDRKFTGQTEDETAGLYWYASRAYDPAIGRFVSPDSIVPAPGNPQSLNRYSYVYNNPLKYVDPSGHTGEGWDYAWADRYAAEHDRDRPTWADWIDYQHSLLNSGSGPGGDWTDQDWMHYTGTTKPIIQSAEWFDDEWLQESQPPQDVMELEVLEHARQFLTEAQETGWIQEKLGDAGHGYLPITLPNPEQVDLGSNIRKAAQLRSDPLGPAKFVALVRPGGEWDYKHHLGRRFENFGNFHFGVVGAAYGLPDELLMRGAGVVHSHTTGGGEGLPGLTGAYGDDPKDQYMISLGIQFLRAMSTSVVRQAAKL